MDDFTMKNGITELQALPFDGRLYHDPLLDTTQALIPTPFESNHAADLVELPDGSLLCVWFAGTDEGNADISIFNQSGQKVSTVFNGNLQAGSHQYGWNAINADGHLLVPGVYYCRLTVNGQTLVKKIVLLP